MTLELYEIVYKENKTIMTRKNKIHNGQIFVLVIDWNNVNKNNCEVNYSNCVLNIQKADVCSSLGYNSIHLKFAHGFAQSYLGNNGRVF